jgi:hypothetical protein
VASPIITGGQYCGDLFGYSYRRRLRDAQEYDAARCFSATSEDEFAKTFVEGDQEAIFGQRAIDYANVRAAR